MKTITTNSSTLEGSTIFVILGFRVLTAVLVDNLLGYNVVEMLNKCRLGINHTNYLRIVLLLYCCV